MPKSRKRNRPVQRQGSRSPKRFSLRVGESYKKLSEADAARKAGRISDAIKILEPLVDEYPDYVAALHNLGLAHLAKRNYWPALSCFVRASMLNPEDWTILTSLAQSYLSLGANEMAIQVLEQARAIAEDEAEIHYTLGLIYDREREYALAVEAFEKATDLDPDHAQATLALGLCRVHLGDLKQAAVAFDRSHRSNPASLAPITASAQLPGNLARFDVAEALRGTRKQSDESDEENRVRMAFAEANLLHRAGEFEAAWEMLDRANRPISRRIQKELEFYRERRKVLLDMANEHAASGGSRTKMDERYPVSLFILGISRSGKTTVERALSTLAGVTRGYENPIVERAVKRASQGAGLLTMQQLGDLPAALDDKFTKHYLAELTRRVGGASIFTNTHPGRIGDVGKLARLVPNARFVFLSRDREDTVLRIYMKHFREGGNYYAYTVPDILAEIDWYAQMISIWQRSEAVESTMIRYEDFVADPGEVLGEIGQICGVPIPDRFELVVGDDRGCASGYTEWINAVKHTPV